MVVHRERELVGRVARRPGREVQPQRAGVFRRVRHVVCVGLAVAQLGLQHRVVGEHAQAARVRPEAVAALALDALAQRLAVIQQRAAHRVVLDFAGLVRAVGRQQPVQPARGVVAGHAHLVGIQPRHTQLGVLDVFLVAARRFEAPGRVGKHAHRRRHRVGQAHLGAEHPRMRLQVLARVVRIQRLARDVVVQLVVARAQRQFQPLGGLELEQGVHRRRVGPHPPGLHLRLLHTPHRPEARVVGMVAPEADPRCDLHRQPGQRAHHGAPQVEARPHLVAALLALRRQGPRGGVLAHPKAYKVVVLHVGCGRPVARRVVAPVGKHRVLLLRAAPVGGVQRRPAGRAPALHVRLNQVVGRAELAAEGLHPHRAHAAGQRKRVLGQPVQALVVAVVAVAVGAVFFQGHVAAALGPVLAAQGRNGHAPHEAVGAARERHAAGQPVLGIEPNGAAQRVVAVKRAERPLGHLDAPQRFGDERVQVHVAVGLDVGALVLRHAVNQKQDVAGVLGHHVAAHRHAVAHAAELEVGHRHPGQGPQQVAIRIDRLPGHVVAPHQRHRCRAGSRLGGEFRFADRNSATGHFHVAQPLRFQRVGPGPRVTGLAVGPEGGKQ